MASTHLTACLLATTALTLACGPGGHTDARRIEPVYDRNTGRLQLLKYDSDGNGTMDTFSYMDGARVVRIEIDMDEDGKIDRWEYYGADQKIERVGFSRADDGQVDAWSYADADGTIVRIELSAQRDGKVTRTEEYEKGVLVRAEDDTDADGKIDKWEIYQDGRLISVAFDTTRRGMPDRRLVYGADGNARLEVDQDGNGQFVAASRR